MDRWGRRRPKLTGAPARRGSQTPLAGWVLPSGATGPTLPRVTPTVSPTRGSAERMARVTLFIGGPRAVLDRCDNGVETAQNARKRKGRDSNPGDRSRGLTVLKTAAFNRSATLPWP